MLPAAVLAPGVTRPQLQLGSAAHFPLVNEVVCRLRRSDSTGLMTPQRQCPPVYGAGSWMHTMHTTRAGEPLEAVGQMLYLSSAQRATTCIGEWGHWQLTAMCGTPFPACIMTLHRITLRMGLELRSLAQQYIVREAVLLDLVQQVQPAATISGIEMHARRRLSSWLGAQTPALLRCMAAPSSLCWRQSRCLLASLLPSTHCNEHSQT
jgi:hypothetical protein